MTQLTKKAEPIYELDDAIEKMLHPDDTDERVTYVQVRSRETKNLLRGMAAAAEHLRADQDLVGIDYNLIEGSGGRKLEHLVTLVLQDRDDDGWQIADDETYAVRVTTAR